MRRPSMVAEIKPVLDDVAASTADVLGSSSEPSVAWYETAVRAWLRLDRQTEAQCPCLLHFRQVELEAGQIARACLGPPHQMQLFVR